MASGDTTLAIVAPSPENALNINTIASHISTELNAEHIAVRAVHHSRPRIFCCISILRNPRVPFACPIFISHFYHTVVLFALPNKYEARIQAIDESSEAFALLVKGTAFASEWWTAGGLCTIMLPLSGSMLQVQRVVDSSLSTILVLMTLFSALEGLLVSAICFSHFSTVTCEAQARSWLQHTRQSFARSKWWNIAVVLSMSASNLIWSVIFFMLALITMYACPQAVCSTIERILARTPDLGYSIALWILVALRTAYVLYHIRMLRLLHKPYTHGPQAELELGIAP